MASFLKKTEHFLTTVAEMKHQLPLKETRTWSLITGGLIVGGVAGGLVPVVGGLVGFACFAGAVGTGVKTYFTARAITQDGELKTKLMRAEAFDQTGFSPVKTAKAAFNILHQTKAEKDLAALNKKYKPKR